MCHNTYVATYSYNYIGLFPAPLALFVFVCRASPLVWSPPPVHFRYNSNSHSVYSKYLSYSDTDLNF